MSKKTGRLMFVGGFFCLMIMDIIGHTVNLTTEVRTIGRVLVYLFGGIMFLGFINEIARILSK